MLDSTPKKSTVNNAGPDSNRGQPGESIQPSNSSAVECPLKFKLSCGRNVQTDNTEEQECNTEFHREKDIQYSILDSG